jgi:hypothetical protein
LRTRCALRAHELAALLGVSRASVSRALARGELKGVTVAGVLVLPLHELQRVGLFPGDPSGDSEATAAENPRPGADSSGSASVSDAKDDSGRG